MPIKNRGVCRKMMWIKWTNWTRSVSQETHLMLHHRRTETKESILMRMFGSLTVWEQHVSPKNLIYRKSGFISGNRRPTRPQQPVPLPTTFSSWLLSFWRNEQWTADISAMFDPPREVQVQAPVAARLHWLAHLGDSSFQLSITCKMRKKSSGSFTSLVQVLCLFVEVFSEFVEVWVYLWRFVYLRRFCVDLWKFLVN